MTYLSQIKYIEIYGIVTVDILIYSQHRLNSILSLPVPSGPFRRLGGTHPKFPGHAVICRQPLAVRKDYVHGGRPKKRQEARWLPIGRTKGAQVL